MFIVNGVSGALLHCINFRVATDPAAGSGSLISSAMKVFNINGNQVVANDINPKLIELLSLYLPLSEFVNTGGTI